MVIVLLHFRSMSVKMQKNLLKSSPRLYLFSPIEDISEFWFAVLALWYLIRRFMVIFMQMQWQGTSHCLYSCLTKTSLSSYIFTLAIFYSLVCCLSEWMLLKLVKPLRKTSVVQNIILQTFVLNSLFLFQRFHRCWPWLINSEFCYWKDRHSNAQSHTV